MWKILYLIEGFVGLSCQLDSQLGPERSLFAHFHVHHHPTQKDVQQNFPKYFEL